MADLFDNKLYWIGLLILVVVLVGFLIDYQIKNTVRKELNKLKHKLKKLRALKMKQRQVRPQQNNISKEENKEDIDSYVDPVEMFENERAEQMDN